MEVVEDIAGETVLAVAEVGDEADEEEVTPLQDLCVTIHLPPLVTTYF